jgi:hypothetical protein
LNTLYLLASGVLILYAISRLFRKKEKPILETIAEKQQEAVKSTTNTGISFLPTPLRGEPTYVEYFNWLRLKENVNYKAVS